MRPTIHILKGDRTLCADRSLVRAIAEGLLPLFWPIGHGQVSRPDAYETATCEECRSAAGLSPVCSSMD